MTLVIEVEDRDADTRWRRTFEIGRPSPGGERAELEARVGGIFPAARLRSFEDGLAVFSDGNRHIAAHELLASSQDAVVAGQDSLFAA